MKLAQRKAVGYVMACFALFIIVFGTIGYTIEGQVEDVPTPNIEGYVFFSDEALPQNPVGLFVSADTSITWDRDDIFLVIANESKKDQCDGIRANGGAFLQSGSGSQTCQYGDSGYETTSTDGSTGAQWHVISGEYYAGIGTKLGTLPAGTELNIDYEVKLSASFPTYLFSLLLGIGGLALTRME
tara:strand:+ start:3016 stop:3570 length:555 start_codon:yes stop_codon:yes gene_type:complete